MRAGVVEKTLISSKLPYMVTYLMAGADPERTGARMFESGTFEAAMKDGKAKRRLKVSTAGRKRIMKSSHRGLLDVSKPPAGRRKKSHKKR